MWSNHDVKIMFESVMRLCVSTYTGWDHKWDLLVIESVHVICVDWVGAHKIKGRGEVFALKRQRRATFWVTGKQTACVTNLLG